MANNIIRRTWKQGGMVNIEDLRGSAFQAEDGGHTFLINGVDENGDALALSGTPAGVLLRADGQDVTLTCSVSDGVVSATLPANAYVVPGRVGITIFLTNGGQKTAIYAAVGSVATTSSGIVAPPAGSDVVDLVNAIATAVATIPASYTDLMAAVASTYSTSALYAVGSYAWYSGKLYRCTTAITSGETWTSAHWTQANLGSDVSDLKSALNRSTDVEIAYFTDGGYITTNLTVDQDTVNLSSVTALNTMGYCIMDCQYGDQFEITGKGGASGRLWAILDSNNLLLKKSANSTTYNKTVITVDKATASKIVFNTYIAGRGLICKRLPLGTRFTNLEEELSYANGNGRCLTTTHTLKELIPATTNGVFLGKMNSSGGSIGADNYYTSRVRFYAKKGSYFQIPTGSSLVSFSVALFDAQSGGNKLSIIQDTTSKYVLEQDGYVKIDVQVPTETTRDRTKIYWLEACIIQNYQKDEIAYVSNLYEFIQASATHRIIYLTDNIQIAGEAISMDADSIVYGNGYKIYGSASVNYFVEHWSGYHEWHDVEIDATYCSNCAIKPNGTATVKYFNCEIYGTDGDGIAPSGSSKVYCYNCKFHDNQDEGFSSHDSTYCELHDCEVYHNAYIPFTDEPSEYSSYGGIHLGGNHVGIVEGCYAHHNRGGGINLAPLGQGEMDEDMTAFVLNNIVSDNTRNGIRLEGLFNCRVIGNTVINNGPSGWSGIAVWKGQNTGESETTSGIIAKNAQALNGTGGATYNTVSIAEGSDGGITVVE